MGRALTNKYPYPDFMKEFNMLSKEDAAKHKPKNMTVNGLCYSEDMEKEANLQVSRLHAIRLVHPVFTPMLTLVREQIYEELKQAVCPDEITKERIETLKAYKKSKGIFIPMKHHPFATDRKGRCYTLYNPYAIKFFNKYFAPYTLEDIIAYYTNTDSNVVASQIKMPSTDDGKIRFFINNITNRIVLEDFRVDQIPCTCQGNEKKQMVKLLDTAFNTPDVICYNSCLRTLFAATKRQLQQVAPPDKVTANEFIIFCRQFLDKYVTPKLKTDFDYNVGQWLNHLDSVGKQEEIERAREIIKTLTAGDFVIEFGMFCKREKQAAGGKNRAIAPVSEVVKLIMGPVCWALEDFMGHNMPGYCGGKSFEQLEDFYEQCLNDGFQYILQGDGSAFDLCQNPEVKGIDRYIYSQIEDKVYHVDKDLFHIASQANVRTINAKYRNHVSTRVNKQCTFISASVVGTVFSGAPDTTLMNTMRMAMYNHFTLARMGMEYDKDYRLLCKGDDFIIFVKDPDRAYEYNYYKYWLPKVKNNKDRIYEPRGIGIVLKFLKIGKPEDADFLSTCAIPVRGTNRFKIVQRPERMIFLTHYSTNALEYSHYDLRCFLLDRAEQIENYAANMPFYENFIYAFREQAKKIKLSKQVQYQHMYKLAKHKRFYQITPGHKCRGENAFEYLYTRFEDSHERYAAAMRVSTNTIPRDDVYDFLLRHYHLTRVAIEQHLEYLIRGLKYDMASDFISTADLD